MNFIQIVDGMEVYVKKEGDLVQCRPIFLMNWLSFELRAFTQKEVEPHVARLVQGKFSNKSA
ncbi:hypothetical protein JK635_07365 [Neobacillus sp. YIM B02564]|uniref:Uncharacterized protein n=1 Tax=Neobacillus paridis TaxID=2803862 RepID=A0ABS1TL38_9BACI|nr:hypothetical protein [Neobacillus paridis]MBL4952027.1 hypothetical protein [Neobacillus paridis]